MGKLLNKVLKSKLVFNVTEREGDQPNWKQIIISSEYQGIYRQYSFHFNSDEQDEDDLAILKIEAKNILTQTIDDALSKTYVRCLVCGQHLLVDNDKSVKFACDNCGTLNEIKVLTEKK